MSLGRLRLPLIIAAWVIAVAVVVILGGRQVWDYLSQRWEFPKEDVRTGLLTMPADGDKDPLQVRAWVSPNKVGVGDVVPFWISFTNKAGQTPVTNLRFIKFEIAGFDTAEGCWIDGPLPDGRLPGCLEGKRNTKGTLPERLEPAETVSVSAKLKAQERVGMYAPTAVFGWAGDRGIENRQAISLGPVEVIDPAREKILYRTRRLKEIATLLVLPIIFAGLGYWFQKATQAQAERSQVWQGLLAQSLDNAQKYYMPLVDPIPRLKRYFDAAVEGRELGRRVSFYSVMLFLRRMKFLSDEIGGVHFKDLPGEAVVASSWWALSELIDDNLGYPDLQSGLRYIGPREDFASFSEKYLEKSKSLGERLLGHINHLFGWVPEQETQKARIVLQKLRGRFDAWVDDREQPFAAVIPLFEIIMETTAFEINRPFERWYGGGRKMRPLNKSMLEEAAAKLGNLPETKAVRSVKARLADYLRDG